MNTVSLDVGRPSEALERELYAKVSRRLLPLLAVAYFIAYVDRVNVGFAKLSMLADLRMSDAAYGAGAGLFFVGYVLFETPSNLVLAKLGARAWIARIMITWGLLSAGTMFVTTPGQFNLLRFMVGVAEAGFLPGVLYYLSLWFPSYRRGRVFSLFILGLPVAGILGSPISGLILHGLNGAHGVAGWRWLFLLEGLPAVVIGLLVLWKLPSQPARAAWLTEAEKLQIDTALKRDKPAGHSEGFMAGLCDLRVWILGLVDFAILLTTYALAFWLPTFIRSTGVHDPVLIGWYTAIPNVAALICMLALSYSSDLRRERRWHLMVPFIVGIGAILVFPHAAGNLIALIAVASLLSGAVTGAVPVFFSLPATFLTGPAAAAGFAVACSVANIAGFVSNLVIGWSVTATGSASLAMLPFAAFLVIAIIIVYRLPRALVNR